VGCGLLHFPYFHSQASLPPSSPSTPPLGSAKFEVLTVSPVFEGKALLQRHRAVNTALAAELEHIHAITLKCLTPAQWEEKKTMEQQAT